MSGLEYVDHEWDDRTGATFELHEVHLVQVKDGVVRQGGKVCD